MHMNFYQSKNISGISAVFDSFLLPSKLRRKTRPQSIIRVRNTDMYMLSIARSQKRNNKIHRYKNSKSSP